MRILVTGGTGTVGEAVVTELVRRGHEVRLLSRHATDDAMGWPERVTGIDGDVGDPASVSGAADGCAAVLHLAAVERESPPEATFQRVNVDGTRHVLAEAERAGARRFVYVSSLGAERGTTDYHASKRAAEALVRASGLNWTICRVGSVYGPGDPVISLLLIWVRTLPAVPVIDDGDQPFQPVAAEDLACGLATCVERHDLVTRVLELAGTDRTSMNDVVERIGRVIGRDAVRVPIPHMLASLGIKAVRHLGVGLPVDEGQITMLREGSLIERPEDNALVTVLGVTPTPLDEGLRRLADRQPEQLPQDGVGALERKRFWADIEGSRLSPEEAMRRLGERFDEITPWMMDLRAEPGTPTRLEEGLALTMELPMRRRVQVRVVEMTPRRITVVTLRGHPLAGAVRFLAEQRGDRLRFEVQVYDRSSNAADWLVMRSLGTLVQSTNWTALVQRMVEETGGRAPEGVQEAEDTLDDEQAREVETWLAELVRAWKRAERGRGATAGTDQHTQRPTGSGASAAPPG
ncbi:MAG TPA: NAD(P)H-binding protein [Gemmatimonadaceae bacterium]|nr:NAD(P)H-binding protein [Gemmatimonadaceae bacterium]